MRRILFLCIFAIICGTAYSQKIVTNEKDDFTGSHVIETNYVKISDGFTCGLRSVDNICILMVSYNGGKEIYTMEKDAEFMIKLSNGTLITLTNLEISTGEYKSITVGNAHISHFLLQTMYELSNEQLKELQGNTVAKVRFYTTSGYIERDVSDKNGKKLLKLFNLM